MQPNKQRRRSILLPGMDGRGQSSSQDGHSRSQTVAFDTLRRSAERDGVREIGSKAAGATGTNFRSSSSVNIIHPGSIRTVTPEPPENGQATSDVNMPQPSQFSRGYGTASNQTSPRSIPGGEQRRQGIVFDDAFSSYDSSESSPPLNQRMSVRPRTHTMDTALAMRQQIGPSSLDARHRVGSFSSAGSTPYTDVDFRAPPTVRESVGSAPIASSRPPDLKITASSSRDKKAFNKRLTKRTPSRPNSPLVSPPPSVSSLPLSIPTDNASKLLMLMKTLCGRMRGEVEYQSERGGAWESGLCYIHEERGSLMFESAQSGFHIPIVRDLRGCKVVPFDYAENGQCLEISNKSAGVELLLRPTASEEFDLWLAALLCWQQIQPGGTRLPSSKGSNSPAPSRTDMRRGGSVNSGSTTAKEPAVIKLGQVMLWDKGAATSPRAIMKRPSTRDLHVSGPTWRRVSCILDDSGDLKLMTESDATILAVIDLSQLSRSAIQRLDRTVLDEDYCIAIFPIYSSAAKQLSIFRPVYIALDSRVQWEVWLVLLRAFAVPNLYGQQASDGQAVQLSDLESEFDGQIFRLEKAIELTVTEAKIRKAVPVPHQHRHGHSHNHKKDADPLVGNYMAEVILDGEVRARTTIQTNTKLPFWREPVLFTELSTKTPSLSVVLKRIDGNLDSLPHQIQASLRLPKTGDLTEVLCGSVGIALDKLERGKSNEQWHQMLDEASEEVASLSVKVNYEEAVVLLTKDYESLSEILHQFSNGLTTQIAQAMNQQLRRLAEIFLNIFQVSNSVVEWFSTLVEEEIDGLSGTTGQNSMKKIRFTNRLKSNESQQSSSDREQIVRDMGKSLTGEANLLFRGNTLLTQALECHMRRLGSEYLEETLGDKLFEINEINPDCEVDPGKLQQGDDVHKHWNQLMQLTTEVWECILASANKLPAELRRILKYIRAVAEDRYGDFLRTVAYTSVSGFLFLRFICPAVLNPKLFGLLRNNIRPRAQRTLTLIAKGLQVLANLSTFGRKEDFMEPMNKFINMQRQPFKDFIDRVCSIPSERPTAVVPPMYTTPINMLNRLSPLAREGFPALPFLVDKPRNFAGLVSLWLDAQRTKENGSNGLEGDLREFHHLCLEIQKRSDECLASIERARTDESLSITASDLGEGFEQASIADSINMSYGTPPPWFENEEAAPRSSSETEGARSIFGQLKGGGREASPRQLLDEMSAAGASRTIRRTGRERRRVFLSGLLGGGKKSKESLPSGPVARQKSKDKTEKEKAKVTKPIADLSDTWRSGVNSRH